MIADSIYNNLIESFKQSFGDIAAILKALGNEKRLQILIFLLIEPHSFGKLINKVELKKTALSNHLTHLSNARLIEKVDYGVYSITEDGIEFIKAIDNAYKKSPTRQLEKFEGLQRRSISTAFLNRFPSERP